MLFSAATAGIAFGVLGIIIAQILANAVPGLLAFKESWIPWPFAGSAFIALILGPISAGIVNLIVDRRAVEDWSILRFGTGLERLFLEATDAEKNVLITLEDGKVYIGLLEKLPRHQREPDTAYVRVLPLASGYRNENHRLELTTWYTDVYASMLEDNQLTDAEIGILNDFIKVIPISRIVSASIFDFDSYNRFQFNGVTDSDEQRVIESVHDANPPQD